LVASLPVIRFERWRHVPAPGEAFVDAIALLKVLYEAREHAGVAAVTAEVMHTETGLGFDEMVRLLERMQQQQWVGRVKLETAQRSSWGSRPGDEDSHWALLVNPAQLTLADVYRLFVFDVTGVYAGQITLIKQVEAAIEHGLGQPLSQFLSEHMSSEWRHPV
jgi:membrane protein